MTQQNRNEDDLLDPRFLEKSYQEAMELTQAVAGYLEGSNKQHRNFDLSVETDVYYASESMRVSTCLMQVMAWFLVQKGVVAGEITKEEASASKFRLGAKEICSAKIEISKGNFPATFVEFHRKSQDLYRQVARIDRMVYGEDETTNPVHQLFNKLQSEDISE